MVEFEPPSPEKAREKQQEQQKPETASDSLRNEAFDQRRDVQRVSDNQGDKPKDPAQVYQTVFAELNAAKQGMKDVVGVIDKGGGPYAQGDGFKAYQQTLDSAQQHYTNARLAADTFLYQCDQQGNPVLDNNGKPIPTKENIALQQQRDTLEKEMKALANDQSPAGRQRLQQDMEQSHQISDLLRSSGYARANNAFALMFHSADLKDPERKNFAKTGVALLGMAATFDGKMWGPPPDANFMKHYDSAMDAVMGGSGRPADQNQPPRPADQTQPPKPGDQTQPPKPGDQTQKPSDQGPKPGDVMQIKDVPGGTVGVDGNKFYINYAGFHVPTWSKSNPDGSPAQAFKGPDGNLRGDGMLRPVVEQAKTPDGKPATTPDGKPIMNVMAVDGQPIMDKNGQRRVDDKGKLIPTKFDASDPKTMLAQVDASVTGPLNDANRANYNTVIDSADKIDRVSLARAVEMNTNIINNSEVHKLTQQMADDFGKLGQFKDLTQPQIDGLKAMWKDVKRPEDLDKWLKDPANKASSDALQGSSHWKDISALYTDYLTAENKVKANPSELAKVQSLEAMNAELGRVFMSSVDARAGYLAKLLVQDDVKKFMAADKNSPDAKALAAGPNVQEAQRVMLDLAKMNPARVQQLDMTAKQLGLDLSKAAAPKPADQVQPPKPADQAQPPKPADQAQPPKPADQAQPPKPADQAQPPKPADQTQPPKPAVESNQRPADQTQPPKPADQTQPPKPAEANPPAAAAVPEKLSNDQLQSAQVAFEAGQAYKAGSEGFSKPMSKENFAKIAPIWEKAIEINASIDPKTLDKIETQVQLTFATRMQILLAGQKNGAPPKTADDLKSVSLDEVHNAQKAALAAWGGVSDELTKQVLALSPENRQKFDASNAKFQAAIEQANKDAGTPPDDAKLNAAYTAALKSQTDEQKALSPDLAKAIDARDAILKTPAGQYAKDFADDMQRVDSFKHVDQARVQYAQALVLQGEENNAKAAAVLSAAMKNPEVAKVLQSDPAGQQFLAKLNLATPDMAKAQDQQDKLYPEMKLARMAAAALADKSKDPKAAWAEADKLYKQAEEASDKELVEKGGGKDVADSLVKVNQIIASMEMQLGNALEAYKSGARELPKGSAGPDGDKADDQIVKGIVKDMSRQDMIVGLMGGKGPQVQAAMRRILNEQEVGLLQNMAMLSQKAAAPAMLRMNHALAASEYGTKNNDKAALDEAKTVLTSIAQVDPQTFNGSPEILGALKQAEQGRQMDVANGRASSIAFTEAAKDTINKTQSGLIDKVIPTTSLWVNTLTVPTTGFYASDIPIAGAIFGGNKEATAKIIDQMAYARLKNEDEAKAQRDQVVGDGHKQLRGIAGDVTGVAASFGTGYLTNWGLNAGMQALERAPLPFIAKAPIVVAAALGVGGLTNNAVRGTNLLNTDGFIRNTVATGTTYAAIKGMEYLPGNRTLSAETTTQLAQKLGYQQGVEVTGLQVARDASAAEAVLGKGKLVQFAEALPQRVNPLNYLGVRFAPAELGKSSWNLWSRAQFAGFGGETTAKLFASGTMSLAEYNARQWGAKTLATAGLGYGFGALNKGAAIYTGEHLDGKKYDTLGSYLTDMNSAGLQTAATSALVMPLMVAPFTPKFITNNAGKLATSMFTRIGVADVPAATAALGTSALMFSQSGMESAQRYGESAIFADMYRRSDPRFKELKAAQDAERALQQGAAPPKPETDKK